jgi:hypothetical protein
MSEARRLDHTSYDPVDHTSELELVPVENDRSADHDQEQIPETPLATRFVELLKEPGDYQKANVEQERRPLRAFMAQTFVKETVQRVIPEPLRSRMATLVTPNHLHRNIEHFFILHPQHLPQTSERIAVQEQYLDAAAERALDFRNHPEIFATERLLDEARTLGHAEAEDAARILLASYGRALIQTRGIGYHARAASVR